VCQESLDPHRLPENPLWCERPIQAVCSRVSVFCLLPTIAYPILCMWSASVGLMDLFRSPVSKVERVSVGRSLPYSLIFWSRSCWNVKWFHQCVDSQVLPFCLAKIVFFATICRICAVCPSTGLVHWKYRISEKSASKLKRQCHWYTVIDRDKGRVNKIYKAHQWVGWEPISYSWWLGFYVGQVYFK
jgi:hypothetical protein